MQSKPPAVVASPPPAAPEFAPPVPDAATTTTPAVAPDAPSADRSPASTRPRLKPSEKAHLRAISLVCEKTIDAWWAGRPVRAASAERLERAALQLGIAV